MSNEVVMLEDGLIGLVVESRVHGTQIIKISPEDYALVGDFKWCVVYTGAHGGQLYAMSKFGTNRVKYLHRVIMGFPPKGLHVDHKDEDGLNNSRPNLRILTHGENIWRNREGKRNRY